MALIPIGYDYKEFTLPTATDDYDIRTNIAELFDNIKVARRVLIQADKTIEFRFNNIIMPLIELRIGEGPYQLPENFLDVTDIFMSNNSGDTVTIRITLV